jgi:hypothetical protein
VFASRSLVIVLRRGLGALGDGARRRGAALAPIPPENLLVFVESAGDSERKHLNPLRAACAACCPRRPAAERAPPLGRPPRRAPGLRSRPTPGTLFELPRLDAGEVFNELDKLAAWAGPDAGAVTREQALAIVHPAGARRSATSPTPSPSAAPRSRWTVSARARGRESPLDPVPAGDAVPGALRLSGGGGGWVRDRRRSGLIARTGRPPTSHAADLLYRCERAWKTGRRRTTRCWSARCRS